MNRAALPAIFNPEDLNALELALELKDRYGARVVVATMGMPAAAEVLRQSLYRGADEAVLVTDRALAGADTLATSYTLSCCAKKLGRFDLILCGRQAIDGDTAQVGPQLAEKLKIPQLCYVEEVKSLEKGKVTVRRAIEGGYEILLSTAPGPADRDRRERAAPDECEAAYEIQARPDRLRDREVLREFELHRRRGGGGGAEEA
ncbi:MAG: hypothetical protein V8T86_04495 [Victivallis sp.]